MTPAPALAAAVVARVLAFALCLPLGPWVARLAAGLVGGLSLAVLVGSASGGRAPDVAAAVSPVLAIGSEVLLGATLGLLCGLPVHAARALRATADAPASLGFAGRIWAWAVFFAIGGPGLVLALLATSFMQAPAARWLTESTLVELGALCFYGPLVLGLPLFLSALLVEPAAALVDRLTGAPLLAPGAAGMRGVLWPLGLLIAAPFLADELRGLLLHTLVTLGAPT